MRIRECMKAEPMAGMLKVAAEVDEAYIGGKPRYTKKQRERMGMGPAPEKSPVIVLVQRDGPAICKPLMEVTSEELRRHVVENVSPEAKLITDELAA